jgi:hypothetical protein
MNPAMKNYTPPTDTEIQSILDTVMREMTVKVGLTIEQTAAIRILQEKKLRGRAAKRAEALKTGKIMEYKQGIDAKTMQADTAVLALLSTEQQGHYKLFHESMKARNKGGPMASRKTFLGKEMGGNGGEHPSQQQAQSPQTQAQVPEPQIQQQQQPQQQLQWQSEWNSMMPPQVMQILIGTYGLALPQARAFMMSHHPRAKGRGPGMGRR